MAKSKTTQSPLDAALSQVVDGTSDVVGIWREAFAHQVRLEDFRRWQAVLREVPEELLAGLIETRTKNPRVAFAECCPSYVSLEEFQQLATSKQVAGKKEITE